MYLNSKFVNFGKERKKHFFRFSSFVSVWRFQFNCFQISNLTKSIVVFLFIRMRLLILTCIALFVFHGPSLCGAVRMSRAGSETSATFKAEESGDLHIYGSLLVLISNAINGLRQISSNLHDTLTQEIKYDGISLDKMYLDHLHKTMESLLLNATLMARKLESDSQSMVEQNQSMAVVENDYSSYSIPNVSLSQLSRKNCGWQTQPIPNSMIQIV